MGYIEKTYGRSEKFLAFKVCFYDTLVPTREYKSGYAADRFARKCAAQGLWCSLHGLAPGWPVATTGNMPMTDSEWLHYRDLNGS